MSLHGRGWATLAFVHRWLGASCCFLFLSWFLSGIVMIYVRMPEVTAEDRLSHLLPLAADRLHVGLEEARRVAHQPDTSIVELAMLGDRPVYRFGGVLPVSVFADRPELLAGMSSDQAWRLARQYAPDAPSLLAHGRLASPDQWTLQLPAHFPLYRFSLGDDRRTDIYLSSKTGDVVMRTTRRERRLAYLGPIAHWLYWPVLRRHGGLWTRVVVWSSSLGCVVCLSGLLAGVLRFSPTRAFRVRGQAARSPYAGWMKLHYYAGLSVGIVTLAWTFSGLLSMEPFQALSSEGITAGQRLAVSGVEDPHAPGLREMTEALRAASRSLTPKTLELIWFGGAPYWLATGDASRSVLVSGRPPHEVLDRFRPAQIEEAARRGAPTAGVELEWLHDYDEYYYDRDRMKPLPVLRARYGDAHGTWMYLDPSRGAIALVVRDRDRLNRWLYHGLHSLDPAWLRNRRRLRDLLVVGLSLGGIVGVAASLIPIWRRFRRAIGQQA
jgi:hypothetical protein